MQDACQVLPADDKARQAAPGRTQRAPAAVEETDAQLGTAWTARGLPGRGFARVYRVPGTHGTSPVPLDLGTSRTSLDLGTSQTSLDLGRRGTSPTSRDLENRADKRSEYFC
jgi:hypothetical protein